jgi:hypothetical protein
VLEGTAESAGTIAVEVEVEEDVAVPLSISVGGVEDDVKLISMTGVEVDMAGGLVAIVMTVVDATVELAISNDDEITDTINEDDAVEVAVVADKFNGNVVAATSSF